MKKPHEIKVKFIDGRSAIHTMAIYNLLITDPITLEIMDTETGEILYTK